MAVIALLIVVISRTNRNLELYHQQKLLASDVQELLSVFNSMDTLGSQVAANMELLNFFIPLNGDGNPSNYFATHLMDSIRAGSLLATINSTDSSALRISVFNRSGDYVSTGSLYETEGVVGRTLQDEAALSALDDALARSPSRAAVLAPHADMWSDNADIRLFTLVRPLSTSYSSKTYGYIAVQRSVEALNRLPLWAREDGAEYALFDAAGKNVSPAGALADLNGIESQLPKSGETVAFSAKLGGRSVSVCSSGVGETGWTLVRVLPTGLLDAPYSLVYTQLVLLGALLLAILLFVVYLLADRISRPLREFSAGIEHINLDNLTQSAPMLSDANTEELQALDRTFRSMLLKLNRSIGFEMKAYMAALQSQMNPHFLYNMLSAIIESADEDGSARTVGMCEKLSSMLRYMADYSNDLVLLRDEIANMRDYLDLMKVRYEEHFDYEVEDCRALDQLRIPRMILQPLTENCFQHGFKNARPPWRILVRFSRDGGAWRIEVTDNGGGVTEAEIAKIHEKIDGYLENIAAKYSELRLGGMGLVNTVLRLRLSNSDPVFFEIKGAPGGGTTVVIGGSL
ncbi:MAG: histidine kinase [Clostridiales bacterium]|nr:histidine kinase [Clostridiales bacterium]